MRIPTVQAVERKIAVVGSALRYCLRFLTPAVVFFTLLCWFLKRGGIDLLPAPLSTQLMFTQSGYVVVDELGTMCECLACISLLICIAAALTTPDERLRSQRPLYWHFVLAWAALFSTVAMVHEFR